MFSSSELQQLVDPELERRETALVNAHGLVVQPDFGPKVHRIELQADDLALPALPGP